VHARLAFAFALAACGGGGGGDGKTDAGGVTDSAPVSSCDPPGHFGGAPALTFDLPPSSTGQFAYADVQAKFPAVDWAHLERL